VNVELERILKEAIVVTAMTTCERYYSTPRNTVRRHGTLCDTWNTVRHMYLSSSVSRFFICGCNFVPGNLTEILKD
jgi:hypothetical protein